MSHDTIEHVRHSLAHLLAAAVQERFPGVKLGIGPVIENGFYYDFQFPESASLSESDLPALEARVRELIAEKLSFTGRAVSAKEARKLFAQEPFKLQLIDDYEKAGEALSVYETGLSADGFTDLCKGGHVKNTSAIAPDAFKLTRIAGAYWKSDEKNAMLTRIYGVAFETKKELEKYLEGIEEAKERDHRKLGKELDLFTFSELVGAGLPLWTPKGTVVREELRQALFDISREFDVLPVTIPHMAKIELYEISGHAEKFKDELFKVVGHYGQDFVLKPVNCPHHTQIYASQPRSYRDLPLRYMESTMQYRDEKPGEIGGLTRVRSITVDDGHTFCRLDQVEEEAENIARIIETFYTKLGLWGKHWVSLSVRDSKYPEKYIGEEKDWQKAEQYLEDVSDALKLHATRREGEAALYGPKLDYMFKDSLGREFQLATIQLDFAMPKRFGLVYIGKDGKEETPIMIHRAILGSYERFLAILLEHFNGALPTWLAPVQAAILPVGEKFVSYARTVAEKLKEAGVRVELPGADETLGSRIRKAEMQRVPYIVVVGDKEEKAGTINVRPRGGEPSETTVQEFITTFSQ